MLEFLVRPLRSALGLAEQQLSRPLAAPEHEIVDAVHAIQAAADSIEHHVQVIEGLALSVGPLTDSVNSLAATMAELVAILTPVEKAERDVGRIEQFFGLHRHKQASEEPEPDPQQP
jgi:hypothetical protein